MMKMEGHEYVKFKKFKFRYGSAGSKRSNEAVQRGSRF